MKVAICDGSREDRAKIRALLEEYQRTKEQTIEIREYDSEKALCGGDKESEQTNQKLRFSFVEGERVFDASDIFYVETDRHKNIFHTTHASYRLYQKLDEIEKRLAPYGFVRVHRSFLVNMRYVKKISSYVLRLSETKNETGALTEMPAEHSIEISVPKSRYAYVKREYADYQKKQGGEEQGR